MEPRDRSPSGSPGLTKTCPGAPGRAGRFPGASAMLPRSVQGVSWTLPHAAQFDFRFQDASGRPNFASRRLQDASKTPENAFGHLQDGQIIYFLRFLVRKRKQIGRQNTMKIDHGARHEESLPVLQNLSFFE